MNEEKYYAVFAYSLQGGGKVAAVTRPEGGIGLPGGKVEENETNIEALRRECEEEGWLINIKDYAKPFFVGSLFRSEAGSLPYETKIAYYKVDEALKLFEYKEKLRIDNLFSSVKKIKKSGNGNELATEVYFKKLWQKRLYKNWGFHNCISHPLSQIVYAMIFPFLGNPASDKLAARIHDWSVPDESFFL